MAFFNSAVTVLQTLVIALDAEADYAKLESQLQSTIDNIESDHPGYDEYRYNLAEIGHAPYELAVLLTVQFENYTNRYDRAD